MSNETDLDWMARNVHEWSDGMREVLVCYPRNVDTLIWSRISSNVGWITKEQWLARRAELQNKPSWGAVPINANWIAQDAAGTWIWHWNKPEHRNGMWINGDTRGYAAKGSVLGDWRDTLERRPERTRAEMEVELVKASFKPFTSIEDNQELNVSNKQEVNQDSGWFERGELPPVGSLCLYVVSDRLSAEVEITAHAKFGLCFVEVGKSGECYVSKASELHRFRPIRTERDVLIEIIKKTDDTDDKIAEAILAAGFSLGAK
ncbi:hypothetical protein [Pseudomonas sp.]|uniref:hypothetical protein n=1 Tax=Pseudomonas sp. TaxID=306 RepID=UPI002FC9917B